MVWYCLVLERLILNEYRPITILNNTCIYNDCCLLLVLFSLVYISIFGCVRRNYAETKHARILSLNQTVLSGEGALVYISGCIYTINIDDTCNQTTWVFDGGLFCFLHLYVTLQKIISVTSCYGKPYKCSFISDQMVR